MGNIVRFYCLRLYTESVFPSAFGSSLIRVGHFTIWTVIAGPKWTSTASEMLTQSQLAKKAEPAEWKGNVGLSCSARNSNYFNCHCFFPILFKRQQFHPPDPNKFMTRQKPKTYTPPTRKAASYGHLGNGGQRNLKGGRPHSNNSFLSPPLPLSLQCCVSWLEEVESSYSIVLSAGRSRRQFCCPQRPIEAFQEHAEGNSLWEWMPPFLRSITAFQSIRKA